MSVRHELDPTEEVLAYSIQELTKDWSEEQKMNFSQECFDHVVTKKYKQLRETPKMKLLVIKL